MYPDIGTFSDVLMEKGIKISRLEVEEIAELIKFHDTHCLDWGYLFGIEDVKKRLRDRHRCYIARENGEIFAFLWVGFNKIYSDYLQCAFELDKSSVASYNNFVKHDCRGKNILPVMKRTVFSELRSNGFRRCYDWVNVKNKSAVNSNAKFNTTVVGKIINGYFLGCYFLIPLIKKDVGIKVCEIGDPFRRWKTLFRRLAMRLG